MAVIRIIITRITVSQTADIHRMVITTAIRMAVTVKAVVTVRMAVTDRTITARVLIIRTSAIIKSTNI